LTLRVPRNTSLDVEEDDIDDDDNNDKNVDKSVLVIVLQLAKRCYIKASWSFSRALF